MLTDNMEGSVKHINIRIDGGGNFGSLDDDAARMLYSQSG